MPWSHTLDCPNCHETYWSSETFGICDLCHTALVLRPSKVNKISEATLGAGELPLRVDPGDLEAASKKLADLIWPGDEVAPFSPFGSWVDFGAVVNHFTQIKPADILILLNLIVCDGDEK